MKYIQLLAEKYPNFSPYSYTADNPVMLVDPDRRDWYKNNETGEITWYEGNEEKKGYTYLGYFVSETDVDGNTTFYNGVTKTQYIDGVPEMTWGGDLDEVVITAKVKKKKTATSIQGASLIFSKEIINDDNKYVLKSNYGDRYSLDYSFGLKTKINGNNPFVSNSISFNKKNNLSSIGTKIGGKYLGVGIGMDASNFGLSTSYTIFGYTFSQKSTFKKGLSFSVGWSPNQNSYARYGFSVRPGAITLTVAALIVSQQYEALPIMSPIFY